jgi:signal transduction histidine kinase
MAHQSHLPQGWRHLSAPLVGGDGGLSVVASVTPLALCAVDVAVVWDSTQPGDQVLVSAAAVVAIAFPIAAGLVARRISDYTRYSWYLIALGVGGAVAALAYSSNSINHSVGRVGFWLIEPLVIAALLALPWGLLEDPPSRFIAAGVTINIAVLFIPTAFLVNRYPSPSIWETCGDDCPRNAFMLVDRQPSYVDDWIRPTREFVLIGLYLAVVAVLANRVRLQTTLGRLLIAPALALAIIRSLDIAGGLALRRVDPSSAALGVLPWIFVMCTPAVALAFLIGLVRSRLFAGEALRDLSLQLRENLDARRLRELLSSALRDPSLELAFAGPGRWLDTSGREVAMVTDGPDRGVTIVRERNHDVAALLHDPALRQQRSFVEAAAKTALSALEHARLEAEREAASPSRRERGALEAARALTRAAIRAQRLRRDLDTSLETVRESRNRIQAAADEERRRIERDLHDGAQERLVTLRLHLDRVAEVLNQDPELALQRLRDLGEEVDRAIEEVRGLARGIYPALLTDEGLADALNAAARRAPVPATLHVENVSRYSQAIESAVYFTSLEALQNAYKHAGADATVSISLIDDGELHFEVRDNGTGFAPTSKPGTGLMSMEDRISAVGGHLTIDSSPGRGTRVAGSVPIQ